MCEIRNKFSGESLKWPMKSLFILIYKTFLTGVIINFASPYGEWGSNFSSPRYSVSPCQPCLYSRTVTHHHSFFLYCPTPFFSTILCRPLPSLPLPKNSNPSPFVLSLLSYAMFLCVFPSFILIPVLTSAQLLLGNYFPFSGSTCPIQGNGISLHNTFRVS